MPGAIAYRDVGKGREQERKLCPGKRDSFLTNRRSQGVYQMGDV
jgi:hypothetical protein